MTILCIESSTSVCSAAICKDGEPIKQCISYEGSNHARLLPRYIEELLSFAREQALSIEAVALSEGPGSYTGLRIGASTAKGLCYGLNIPLIPVPTLDVLCEAARKSLCSVSPKDGLCSVSVLCQNSGLAAERSYYYFGDGAEKCSKIFTKPNWHFIPGIVPEAQHMGALAEQIINHKSQITNHQSIDLAYYEPFYLKEFIAAPSHVKGLN